MFNQIFFTAKPGDRAVAMKRAHHRFTKRAMLDIIADLESRGVVLVVKTAQRITTATGESYHIA